MAAAHEIGRSLSDLLGWPDAPWERVRVTGTASVLATALPIADMAAAAQGLIGLAAAGLLRARGGPAQDVTVDRAEASLSMTAAAYLLLDGRPQSEWDPLTGYFGAADGWVYLHCQFPHLKARLLGALGLPDDPGDDPGDVAAALAGMAAQEIEDRAADAGACAIRRRSRAEWAAHPHGQHLASQPAIAMARRDGAAPRPLPLGAQPLSGVRVLDLSRVIAGPTIGRVLAEHGAEVLRLSAPHLPSIQSLVIDTGMGKRTAHLDLRVAADRARMAALIRGADVMIDAYRPGALAGLGFGPDEAAALNPGLVHIALSAFGADGPWGGRRGYDTYVQAATGLSAEGPAGPARLPCQPLDYLSGYFGAAAALVALGRRMAEGGGWRIDLALARTAHWLWSWADRLPAEPAPPAANPPVTAVDPWRWTTVSDFGEVSALRPARGLSLTPPAWPGPPRPLGADRPEWTG